MGYECHAFHNHTYDYYSRDKSHPNFGYDWHAVCNWDVKFTSAWPKSDQELALNSLSYLSLEEPFHLYYMTVSGHAYQTFIGNSQAAKHRSYVTSILGNDYKNQASLSFISCQYEVELMVKELYEECDRLGILEDTVFVLAPDHFPYGLTEDDRNRVVGALVAQNTAILEILTTITVNNKNTPQGVKDITMLAYANCLKTLDDDEKLKAIVTSVRDSIGAKTETEEESNTEV
jgi:hypothetical protein